MSNEKTLLRWHRRHLDYAESQEDDNIYSLEELSSEAHLAMAKEDWLTLLIDNPADARGWVDRLDRVLVDLKNNRHMARNFRRLGSEAADKAIDRSLESVRSQLLDALSEEGPRKMKRVVFATGTEREERGVTND